MSSVLFISLLLVIIGCTVVFLFYIFSFIGKKSRSQAEKIYNEQGLERIKHLDSIIETCVVSINEIMVNQLKQTNNFMQLDKEEAFHECKTRIYKIATPKSITELSKSLGNLDEWVNSRIEYHVRIHKIKKEE